ncbi:Odorant-binding protein 2a [Microtus ochrogaster]|uniref:Odorant-binding protein 2a n=1 Tax=Microtus ochrogaster TaxID=79684 RepID=A0A8J6GC49_MICOH|nr:Odorant-binding protein 2a [Microtus ochrogaster]
MKRLLLTLILLGLVAVLKAQEFPSDDKEDYSGTWYPKAMIHNGSLPSHNIPSKFFPVKMTALEGGDLEAEVIFWKNGQCHNVKILMKKTDEPGKFTSFDNKRFIYITALPVKDHYIMYCEGRLPGKLFGVGKLVGRNPEENPEAMEEFKKFVQRKGLKVEDIIVQELNGTFSPLGFFWFLQSTVCLKATRCMQKTVWLCHQPPPMYRRVYLERVRICLATATVASGAHNEIKLLV